MTPTPAEQYTNGYLAVSTYNAVASNFLKKKPNQYLILFI